MTPHPRASTNTDIKERGAGAGRGHEGDGEFRREEKGFFFLRGGERRPEGSERRLVGGWGGDEAVTDITAV